MYRFLINLAIIICLTFISCLKGAKKEQTDSKPAIIDETISPEEKMKEEQEIMRLLGISDDEKKGEQVAQQETKAIDEKPDIKKDIKDEDSRITDLLEENKNQKS